MKWHRRLHTGVTISIYKGNKEFLTKNSLEMSTGVKKQDQKQFQVERTYLNFYFSGQTPSVRKIRAETQGRNLKLGTDAKAFKEC